MLERRFIASIARRSGKPCSMLDPRGPRHRRQPRVRDVLGQPDIDVEPERRGDLILEELSQAAMVRIDAAQQLALVEPEGDAVIGLPRARFPRGLLTGQHDGQAIEIGDEAAIQRLVEHVQPRLVCQELADGDSLFALLRELRPVRAHPFFVVEPSPRVGDGQRHRGQALGRRVDDHHGVLLPRLAGLLGFGHRPRGRRPSRRGDRHSRRRPAPGVARSCRRTPRARRSKPGATCPLTRCNSSTTIGSSLSWLKHEPCRHEHRVVQACGDDRSSMSSGIVRSGRGVLHTDSSPGGIRLVCATRFAYLA